MCVLVCVLIVSGLFSLVEVVCGVVFPSDSFSDCEIVEPQTFSLSRKRNAIIALECEAKMNIEKPPVKTVQKAVRNRPHAAKFAVEKRCLNGSGAQRRLHQKGRLEKCLGPPAEVDEMEVDATPPPSCPRMRVNQRSSRTWRGAHWQQKEKTPGGTWRAGVVLLPVGKMERSIPLTSRRMRGTKEDTEGSWCSIRVEALKWLMQRVFPSK